MHAKRCNQCGKRKQYYDLFCVTSGRGASSLCTADCTLICSTHSAPCSEVVGARCEANAPTESGACGKPARYNVIEQDIIRDIEKVRRIVAITERFAASVRDFPCGHKPNGVGGKCDACEALKEWDALSPNAGTERRGTAPLEQPKTL